MWRLYYLFTVKKYVVNLVRLSDLTSGLFALFCMLLPLWNKDFKKNFTHQKEVHSATLTAASLNLYWSSYLLNQYEWMNISSFLYLVSKVFLLCSCNIIERSFTLRKLHENFMSLYSWFYKIKWKYISCGSDS